MVSDLAFHLASRGWEVVAIASAQRYDDPRARLARSEEVNGVQIRRVRTTRFGRGWLPGRAVDYATFYLSAFFAVRREARRGAVVVALTDPPLISVVAMLAAKLRGARLVNWVQDLFPEVAEELGIRVPMARGLRDASLRAARKNVVLGDKMAARVPNAVVQHNWADAALAPVAHDDNPLRTEWGLDDAFVVGYSGNLGRAHEIDTLIRAMNMVPDIRFLIIGAGAQLATVKEHAGPNVLFRPYQPRELLSRSLSVADVHIVSLQPQLEGLIVPSKIYGILAVARPVIFVGAVDGEVANIVTDSGCGVVIPAGDAEGLARAVRELATHREKAREMGEAGRRRYERDFASHVALARWERILEEAAA